LKVSGLNYSIVRPGSLTNEPLSTIELEGKLNKWGEIREDVAQTLMQTLDDNVANKATLKLLKEIL
jgi:hypothetical protein